MAKEKYLIANTSMEQRRQIVADSLGITDGSCDGCASSLADMYDDYIYGKKEIDEINASFRANYVAAEPEDTGSMSCGMGM